MQDAVVAVLLLESSTDSSNSLVREGLDPLHTTFPNKPLDVYQKQVALHLKRNWFGLSSFVSGKFSTKWTRTK